MSEQARTLARRAVEELWNDGNVATVSDLFAGDYVGHQPGNEADGHEGVKQYFGMLREAFPDIHFTVEDQVADGDKSVIRWTANATHKGTFQGIPPTGKRGVVRGITINRVANGKIVEGWTQLDNLGLLQQLGVIPASARAATEATS